MIRRKSRNLFNRPLLSDSMTGPVSRQSVTQDAILTKGNEARTPSVDKGGSEGRYAVNIGQLREKIRLLSPHRDTRVRDLPLELQESVHQIKRIFSLMSKSDVYPQLIEIVKANFGDMSTAKPGTVGALFYGCFLPNKYTGQVHCSAECAASIQPPEVKGWSGACASNVINIEADGTLEFQHVLEGVSHAVIHVFSPRFDGFTMEQAKLLHDRGITRVSIDLVQADSYYTVISVDMPLNDVPVLGVPRFQAPVAQPKPNKVPKRQRRKDRPKPYHDDSDHEESSFNIGGVIIGVIFVVLVIIIIVVLFYVFSGRGAKTVVGTPSGVSDNTYHSSAVLGAVDGSITGMN